MEKNELENKINVLEKKLESYRKKEEYTNAGVKKTKEVYDVARKNAEKIIFKAVSFTHDFKNSIEETLKLIKEKPENFEIYVEDFLNKNSYFISEDMNYFKDLIHRIVNKIYKDSI